jgi:hypothetical protein
VGGENHNTPSLIPFKCATSSHWRVEIDIFMSRTIAAISSISKHNMDIFLLITAIAGMVMKSAGVCWHASQSTGLTPDDL